MIETPVKSIVKILKWLAGKSIFLKNCFDNYSFAENSFNVYCLTQKCLNSYYMNLISEYNNYPKRISGSVKELSIYKRKHPIIANHIFDSLKIRQDDINCPGPGYIYHILTIPTKKLKVTMSFTYLAKNKIPTMEHLDFLECDPDWICMKTELMEAMFYNSITIIKDSAPNLRVVKFTICILATVSFKKILTTGNYSIAFYCYGKYNSNSFCVYHVTKFYLLKLRF